MTNQEFEKFRISIEPEIIPSYSKLTKLSRYLEFFSLADTYDDFKDFKDYFKWNLNICSFLEEKHSISYEQANQKLYDNFIQSGYLFHVTQKKNVHLILQNGIVTLNEYFNNDLYRDCCELNRCWHHIAKKYHYDINTIINIPNKDRLYKGRFNSIYLTSDIVNGLEYYGNGSELLDGFLSILLDNLSIPLSLRHNKEALRSYIIDRMTSFNDREKQVILSFYDKYYVTIGNNHLIDKSIIMVPKKSVIDKNIYKEEYKELLKDKNHFYDHFINCNDIEYHGNISNNDLIAITFEPFENSKIKVKVQR